jgi:hypothetical protein
MCRNSNVYWCAGLRDIVRWSKMRLLLALTGLLLAESVTPTQKPNILYILADDLGKREILVKSTDVFSN